MADTSGLVDTSSGSPSLDVTGLVKRVLGITLFGWITGVVDVILRWGAGLDNALGSISSFFIDQAIGAPCVPAFASGLLPPGAERCRGLIGVFDANLTLAFQQNTAFLVDTFGAIAPIVAVIEIAALLWLGLVIFREIGRRLI